MTELEGPPVPQCLEYLLTWFSDLSAARSSNGFSANPISYTEMQAWAELTGIRPTPFEVECLRALDRALLNSLASKNG